MSLPAHLAVRGTADVAVDDLVRLVRAYESTCTGDATCTRADILLETQHPGHDRDRDGWCLTTPDGDVVAWAGLTTRDDGAVDSAITILPGASSEEIARYLVTRVLWRAAELGQQRGRPLTVTVSGVLRGDTVLPRTLKRAGFVPQHTLTRCEIDLSVAPLPLMLPQGGRIRPIGTADLRALHAVRRRTQAAGTRTMDSSTFARRLAQIREQAARGNAVALLMETDGHVVGHVLAQAHGPGGRIVDTSVAPASRGIGVGLALVLAGLAELRALGCARAFLALDTAAQQDTDDLRRILAVTRQHKATCYRLR
ncbi:GNAT family N-acetyltransferase [Streptomyces sp. PTD5-9]|uniref:GNAT family N-acetyltransferase n=1 Tax=Streptomyces sp. PTD5-9 TaxID=3120150 RepID=UPI003008AAF6